MLARRELPQSKFVEQLCLSAGRVSQILRVLELRGKIIRERRGKESWVRLPKTAQRKDWCDAFVPESEITP